MVEPFNDSFLSAVMLTTTAASYATLALVPMAAVSYAVDRRSVMLLLMIGSFLVQGRPALFLLRSMAIGPDASWLVLEGLSFVLTTAGYLACGAALYLNARGGSPNVAARG